MLVWSTRYEQSSDGEADIEERRSAPKDIAEAEKINATPNSVKIMLMDLTLAVSQEWVDYCHSENAVKVATLYMASACCSLQEALDALTLGHELVERVE